MTPAWHLQGRQKETQLMGGALETTQSEVGVGERGLAAHSHGGDPSTPDTVPELPLASPYPASLPPYSRALARPNGAMGRGSRGERRAGGRGSDLTSAGATS